MTYSFSSNSGKFLENLAYTEFVKNCFEIYFYNKNFECDHYVGFVAVINSKIVGYVDIIFFQDIAHGGFLGQIQNLIVAKEYRGQGIGKRLVKKAIDFAKEMGFKELHVWTKFDNVKAISLYEKMGFKRSSLLLEIEF